MNAKPPSRTKSPGTDAAADAPPAAPRPLQGTLGWARGLFGRPASAAKPAPQASQLSQLLDELGARLVVHDPETQAVRNLFVVYSELRRGGWSGASVLPRRVTGRALAEAEMLESHEPSPLLTLLIDRLRGINTAAEVLADADPAEAEPERDLPAAPEVSETSYDEYELMERSWVGTVPSGIELPERDR